MPVDQLPIPRTAVTSDAKLVKYDQFIDAHIRTTRRMVKLVDFATAFVTLAAGVLAFLLAFAVFEHWLVPSGVSVAVRFLLFAVLMGGVVYYSYHHLWPLLRRSINPVYAARTIEQSSPTLKNTLVNLLLFRQRRNEVSDAVYNTLEEQAAQRLTRVPVESAVDRGHLIRLGYVLIAVVAVAAIYNAPGVKLLKDSRSSTVAEIEMPLGGATRTVIWKRFRVTSWKDPLLAMLRPTGALRSWVMGHGMRLRWLPTPRPLLVLHRRRFGMPAEGYLLTAKVEDAEDLRAFADDAAALPPAECAGRVRPVAEEVARLVRGLHERQLSHRDLKATNLLVTRRPTAEAQAASAEPLDNWPLTASRVWFIDLVGVRDHSRLGRRRKVQNLARINASFLRHPAVRHSDRLRFLTLYLQSALRGAKDWKQWWREIAAATRAKVARNLRSGRPLA